MTTLTKRVITAIVMLVVAGSALFLLPPYAAVAVFASFLAMGFWEWTGFIKPPRTWLRIALLVVVALTCAGIVLFRGGSDWTNVFMLALVWWLGVTVWLWLPNKPINTAFVIMAGLLCLVPAWLALRILLLTEGGQWLLIWLVGIVAAADIGAYFTGKAFGRRKLAPSISPGKTIEGLLGGLVCAGLAGAVGATLLNQPVLLYASLAPLVAVISVVGDLHVSVFKRYAGLKDSGWILPGHGGVMDRLDSLTAAAPVFALLLYFTELLPAA